MHFHPDPQKNLRLDLLFSSAARMLSPLVRLCSATTVNYFFRTRRKINAHFFRFSNITSIKFVFKILYRYRFSSISRFPIFQEIKFQIKKF